MRIRKEVSRQERDILIAMIVDEKVLAHVAADYTRDLFKSKSGNLICRWCVQYYNKYHEPPGEKIENIYDKWSDKTKDKNLVKLVQKFLSSLSDEYEELKEGINSDFVLDEARSYFNGVRLARLTDEVEDLVADGDIEKAMQMVSDHKNMNIGIGRGIDIFQNSEAVREAMEFKSDKLIEYPGDLGKFFGYALERDGFINFMGPEKRGKTWWLIDMAFRAMTQRRRVAFFEVGDLSERQLIKRIVIRNARRPIRKGSIQYPKSIAPPEQSKGQASVRHKTKRYKITMSWRKAWKKMQRTMKQEVRSKHSYLKISTHANSAVKVSQIRTLIDNWIADEWIPDIVIIDYADILNMDYPGLDGRERIDKTWRELRRLSQELHCLVVTATQSDASSYSAKSLSMKHFSNDKRKNAHVTGTIGINQTTKEKDAGIYRLNWVALREEDFSPKWFVHTAGCIHVGNPAIKSCFYRKPEEEGD
jgi:hypothetical protein